MDNFSRDLLAVFAAHSRQTFAWCVLPNHYHALVEAPDAKALLRDLGLLHGRTSHAWNGEEQARGRKVFFRAVERAMRSDRHYWHAELRPSQSSATRLRGAVDRLAMEQRGGVREAKGGRGSEADMAGVPAPRLRKGLGRAGDVGESGVYAAFGVPSLGGLDSGVALGRINAELRTVLSELPHFVRDDMLGKFAKFF